MEDLRPRRSFGRRSECRDASLIVIACEGRVTEPRYFEALASAYAPTPSRVKVKILELPDGHSAPEHVLAGLDRYRKAESLKRGDELWAVIDFDRWGERKLSEVAAAAVQKDYQLVVSRPCFEFWLLLHFRSPSELENSLTSLEEGGCEAARELLRDASGSSAKHLPEVARLMALVPRAIENAKALDAEPTQRFPLFPGSHVYRLAERISRTTVS